MNSANASPLRVYGSEISYFTGKLEGYLRYKEIPYERIEMTTDLVIYGLKGSPFVRKVQVLLAEKGLDYELEMASPFPAPNWFVEISPAPRRRTDRALPILRISKAHFRFSLFHLRVCESLMEAAKLPKLTERGTLNISGIHDTAQ
jgi:hypothetical protein